MPNIMCAQGMWRLVKAWKPLAEEPAACPPTRLGDWAAMTFKDAGETLVLAMEVQTYLTLLFRYAEGEVFQAHFSSALAAALEDLGIQPSTAVEEVSSAGPVRLCRLTDETIREALKHAAYMCGIERMYHDDLRHVQRNLNELPHNLPPDYVPQVAVRRLLGRPEVLPS